MHAPHTGRPRHNLSKRALRSHANGFTLIEALVTIIILAIGVLALAILQVQTLLDSRTAAMRNVATAMAYNLADQMRSNETALVSGTYDKPNAAVSPACYSQAGCTPVQMALTSFAAWKEDVAAALPAGDGFVCIDSTPLDGTPAAPLCDGVANAPYVIKIWWRENNNDLSQPLQLFATSLVP